MSNVLDQMADVRQKRGLPPINPFQIEGFGDGSTPPPIDRHAPETPPEILSASEHYGAPLEPELESAPPTPPPVSRPTPVVARPASVQQQPIEMPEPEVIVVDRQAQFKGYAVVLNETEKALVDRALSQALRRTIAALLPVRRRRRVSAIHEQEGIPEISTNTSGPTKRGRGRPRKDGTQAQPRRRRAVAPA